MHPKLAHQRVEWHHFGGIVRRHLDGFLRRQDVEFIRVEDQLAVACRDRLPEIGDVVAGAVVDIDQSGVTFGAIADERAKTGEIDPDCDALADVGVVVVDQPFGRMQRRQRCGVEHGGAAPKTDLRQARAGAHQHRKRAGADLGVERTSVASANAVEAARAVRNHAGEDVETAGRAFRIGSRRNVSRKRKPLHQRHDVDTAGLQHRTVTEVDLVQLEGRDTIGDRGARAGQEACAHPKRNIVQAQIEARGLDLPRHQWARGNDGAGPRKRVDHAVGQDALVGRVELERHAGRWSTQ